VVTAAAAADPVPWQQAPSVRRASARLSFAHHVSKSVNPGSHRRRIALADTTRPVSTPQEQQLWEQLYYQHTPGTKTRWQAFLLD
jgi:hypothetical protein